MSEVVKDLSPKQWDKVESFIRSRLHGDTKVDDMDGCGAMEALREAAGRWHRGQGCRVDPLGGWDSGLVDEVIKLFRLRKRQASS